MSKTKDRARRYILRLLSSLASIRTPASSLVHRQLVFHSHPLLTISTVTTLVQDPVISRLGYTNSLLASFPVPYLFPSNSFSIQQPE